MSVPIRVLMITSEWPTPERPLAVPFIVRQVVFLRRAGVDVDVLPFQGQRNPINYLRARRRVLSALGRERYDLVHAQFGQAALLPWPKRSPIVVTFRGCEIQGDKAPDGRTTLAGRVLRRLCQLAALGADAVIAVSEHMRAHIPSRIPVHVIPSGLDLESLPCIPREEARRELGLPLDERLVLFVGSPSEPRKRYALARRAVELLNETLPVKLILGWGVPHTRVPVLMSACDAFVFTSFQEGSPNVVKEALACNLPVVSVPVGDVPLRLNGVEGCELCADERPETIAAALGRVLRRGQRINGRQAVQDLDERLLTEKVIRVYQSVLRGRRPQPPRSGCGRSLPPVRPGVSAPCPPAPGSVELSGQMR